MQGRGSSALLLAVVALLIATAGAYFFPAGSEVRAGKETRGVGVCVRTCLCTEGPMCALWTQWQCMAASFTAPKHV